jgi:hypothetical protein
MELSGFMLAERTLWFIQAAPAAETVTTSKVSPNALRTCPCIQAVRAKTSWGGKATCTPGKVTFAPGR